MYIGSEMSDISMIGSIIKVALLFALLIAELVLIKERFMNVLIYVGHFVILAGAMFLAFYIVKNSFLDAVGIEDLFFRIFATIATMIGFAFSAAIVFMQIFYIARIKIVF